jgi:hypothetical protein
MKERVVSFRVNLFDYWRIKRLAVAQKMTVSELVRAVVFDAMRRERQEEEKVVS